LAVEPAGAVSLVKPPAAPDLPQDLAQLEHEPSRLRGLELSEHLIAAVDWPLRDAVGLQLSESRLEDVDLTEARLGNARLRDVVVTRGSWANADASACVLRRVEFRDARLTGVSFANGALDDVVFADCRLDLASFRFAKLSHVHFERCRLDEGDFYEAQVGPALFSDCSLTRASVAGTTFVDTELRGCELTGLGNAERLRNVRMPWADIVQSADVLAAGLGIEIVE
jgi:uncharacterized protein YjbI with pentapeptide repeats